ncbi:MAG: bifunctional UDP-N-acetylglucosamine diphosphorylase/glucosamine-1-phosphate N-acetyltransferase GlmU [Myxococcota bacterium]
MARSVAAIVLAAGQGTRMKSNLAKVLHPVMHQPMVAYPVRAALKVGAAPVVLVVGHQAEAVQADVTARFGDRVRFQEQTERLGTGHAARVGMQELASFDGTVLILSGDVPLLTAETLSRLLDDADQPGCALSMVIARLEDPTGYGRVIRGGGGVSRIVEHKDASAEELAVDEINAGIYAVNASFLKEALEGLSNDNAQGEYYLTDIVAHATRMGRSVLATIVDDPMEVAGANNRAQLAQLDAALRARINRDHMLAGVTLQDPATTYIGPEVTIGQDTTIAPGVHLRGRTSVGQGCTIDVGAVLEDATVGDGVLLKPYTILEDAEVHAKAVVGPFSRLRPGTEVQTQARVGNFVELKKTRLGKGAKANHLAYLGNAEIGDGSNVGAGTITCNYDGYGKYRTELGPGVFVGSNSTLVAPVRIGDNAYVAAGSVITDEVDTDTVAFGRARQVNKQDRAPALRAKAQKAAEKKNKS